MFLTVVFNAQSSAYPLITNRIQASIYLQSAPLALIASQIDTTTGHPRRDWSFPGLQRGNYGFSLDEIDGSGAVVNNLAQFDAVPGEVDGMLVRDDEQIRVGTTPGFVTGSSSFIFDGTETFTGSGIYKPSYIGWTIVPSELQGRGILILGQDYSWDSTTGTFSLLVSGDVFAVDVFYNIHFDDILQPAGNSSSSVNDFSILRITNTSTIDASYFGNKLLIEPVGNYIEITLPSIVTTVIGRPLMVEVTVSNPMCSVKFITFGSDRITFQNGDLYANSSESFWIYRYNHPVRGDEWRLCDVYGNFDKVGNILFNDLAPSSLINLQVLDGTIGDKLQYSRIYNEFILMLPTGQAVNFDDWITAGNQTKFSLANSANPTYTGKFHFPDRRSMFTKSSGGVPGTYFKNQVGEFNGYITFPKIGTSQGQTGTGKITSGNEADEPSDLVIPANFNTGVENIPETVISNQYIVL